MAVIHLIVLLKNHILAHKNAQHSCGPRYGIICYNVIDQTSIRHPLIDPRHSNDFISSRFWLRAPQSQFASAFANESAIV